MNKKLLLALAVLAVPVLSCGQCAVGFNIEQTMNGGGDTVQWVVGAVVLLAFMIFMTAILSSAGIGSGPQE
jgi:hypothetical protein